MPNVYGRARRIAIFKIILLVLLIFIVIAILLNIFLRKPVIVEEEKNFIPLKNYLVGLGYSCDNLDKPGGQCSLKKENSSTFFHRYDDGFIYIMRAKSYTVEIKHVKNMYHEILLTTNDFALFGNRNKKYTCTMQESFLGAFDSCRTAQGEVLATETYIGVIESSIIDVKSILESSGFNVDLLLTEYVWE